jgi:7-cyano-7-deazaguanine reductase
MPKSHKNKIKEPIESPERIRTDVLNPIKYEYRSRRDIDITIQQPEYTALCPMTGMPDFGSIIITYIPDAKIIELKSLKLYLLQYRNVGIFYENAVNRILDDLISVLDPKQMEVAGDFTARGGITTKVVAAYKRKI